MYMYKLVSNLKIKSAVVILQNILKQNCSFLWLLPLLLNLIKTKQVQTVISTQLLLSLFAGFRTAADCLPFLCHLTAFSTCVKENNLDTTF